MSGGAVINLKGELVGLTTASANAAGFDAQAGYAIPMDALGRRLVETLRQGKEFEYGFLGIRLDHGRHRTAWSMHSRAPPPARGASRPMTRSSPSARSPSRTRTSSSWRSTASRPASRSS